MPRIGDLDTQYFDAAGDLLNKGLLDIFESGSTTRKDTWADVNKQFKNTNPIELFADGTQPSAFTDGSYRGVLRTAAGAQVRVLDPLGGDTGSGQFESWNSLTIYSTADIVIGSDSLYYRSFAAGNQGNDPTVAGSDEFWEQVEFLGVWNAFVSYGLNATVKASDGLFYRSLVAANLGNDPVSSPTKWGSPVDVSFTPIVPFSETYKTDTDFVVSFNEGTDQLKTPGANGTYTLADFITGGTNSVSLTVDNAGGHTVDFDAAIIWYGGAPTIGTETRSIVLWTPDDGTTKYGAALGAIA